jgi:hypothetical protein
MLILSPREKIEERDLIGSFPLENRRPVLLVSTPIRSVAVAISSCSFSSACMYARKCALSTWRKEELEMMKPSYHLLCIFLLGTRGMFSNHHAK